MMTWNSNSSMGLPLIHDTGMQEVCARVDASNWSYTCDIYQQSVSQRWAESLHIP